MDDANAGMLVLAIAVLSLAFAVFSSAALAAIGPIWMPFASLICARSARKKGLSVWRYALAGALYSLLLFWPWVYLLARMNDKRVPRFFIGLFYFFVHAAWLLGGSLYLLIGTFTAHPGSAYDYEFGNPHVQLSYAAGALTLISVVTWFMSLTRLLRVHDRESAKENQCRTTTLPHWEYLIPVVYMMVWLAVPWVLMGISQLITEPRPN